MAKTAIRRHHTRRLISKFKRLQQKHNYHISDNSLSFGAVFSKDPFDCGRSNCGVCRNNWDIKTRNNNINFSNYEYDYINYYDDEEYL